MWPSPQIPPILRQFRQTSAAQNFTGKQRRKTFFHEINFSSNSNFTFCDLNAKAASPNSRSGNPSKFSSPLRSHEPDFASQEFLIRDLETEFVLLFLRLSKWLFKKVAKEEAKIRPASSFVVMPSTRTIHAKFRREFHPLGWFRHRPISFSAECFTSPHLCELAQRPAAAVNHLLWLVSTNSLEN